MGPASARGVPARSRSSDWRRASSRNHRILRILADRQVADADRGLESELCLLPVQERGRIRNGDAWVLLTLLPFITSARRIPAGAVRDDVSHGPRLVEAVEYNKLSVRLSIPQRRAMHQRDIMFSPPEYPILPSIRTALDSHRPHPVRCGLRSNVNRSSHAWTRLGARSAWRSHE